MRDYWHRKPLLIRQALPGFEPPLSVTELRRLAANPDAESRLVRHDKGQWRLQHGPFARLPANDRPDWTALVQGVNLLSDAADALLARFRFVPEARLDDLMVSIAGPGGGVGPHFDSYDVFLLQGHGRRRWRWGPQTNLRLRRDLPVRILESFTPSDEAVLEPGDMLYLPPHLAHDGVSESAACTTWSIGFRAPSHQELLQRLYEYKAESLSLRAGRYRDPRQPATAEPGRLPEALIEAAGELLRKHPITPQDIADCLGCWLTEPKAQVFFEPSHEAVLPGQTGWPCRLRLDRRSRMIHRGERLYINGERAEIRLSSGLRRLADDRRALWTRSDWQALGSAGRQAVSNWVLDGWLHVEP
jgi:50S ribosomal protein L16 3-hydroxylase